MKFRTALSLALLASTMWVYPAAAQEAQQETAYTVSPDPVVDADEATGSIQPRRNSFLRIAPPESGTSDVLVPTFQRVASDTHQLRFDGEMGINDLPVYIRPDQLAEPARLRVRYISAVSVMPEASRLQVSINDQPIAEIVLDAVSEAGQAEIKVPPGLLQAGYNVVRFSVQQRHRVDCSIEAANELWTQLEAAGTGLLLVSTNEQFSSVDDLVGFPQGEDGATHIAVVLPQGADIPLIDQTLRAVQALAIRADIQKPRVTFSREPSTQPGIQLFVGTRAQLRASGLDDTSIDDGSLTVNGRGSSIVRVIITGDTADEVNTTIMRVGSELKSERRGTPTGLRALAFQRGAVINAENEIPLSAFGLSTQDFSGRVFHTSFNLVLPSDFYPADNGKAIMFLDAEYSAGLLTSNEALVRVNGKVVGASRLTRSGGETINRRAIEMTLRTLNPGHNRVTLEIRTATEEDKDCNPLTLIDSRKRLTVQASTSFALPRVARAENLPSLGAWASSGYPYAGTNRPVTVYMPKTDTASLGAAATLIARSAVAAGQPMNAQISLRMPDVDTGSAIVVGAINDIPEALIQHFDLREDVIPKAWRASGQRRITGPQPLASNSAQPVAAKPVQVAALPGKTMVDTPAKSAGTAAAETSAEPQRETLDKVLNSTSRFLQRNIGYSAEQLWFLNRGRSGIAATPNTTVLVAQAQSKSGGNDTWLLLTGIDSETLQRDTTELVSPSNWNQMNGRMIAFDPTAQNLTLFPASSHYHLKLRERSISNVTLFAAGWLSNHIQYYVLVLLGVCLVFGVFSRKLLNRIGQKP